MDTSKLTLLIAALIAAFLVSLSTTDGAGAYHQNIYQTILAPPTHADGHTSYNSCGWHTGSCLGNQNGPALDWGYWNGGVVDYGVRFRGWLYRSSTPTSNAYLRVWAVQDSGGPTICNQFHADVYEVNPQRVHYVVRYVHADVTISGIHYVYVHGSGIGAWNSLNFGTMVYDFVGCPWEAYHVHAYVLPVMFSYYSENRARYPCCNYGGTWVINNLEGSSTHTTQFLQGH